MRLGIVAVGQRVPAWAQTAWDDYAKRLPPELKVELKAIKTEPRGSKTVQTLQAAERERIEAAIPRGVRRVALDEHGTRLTTHALAARLKDWQLGGDDVALNVELLGEAVEDEFVETRGSVMDVDPVQWSRINGMDNGRVVRIRPVPRKEKENMQ